MSEQEYYNVADIFGENVFNDSVMQTRLPKKVYKKLHEVMEEGKELDLETADVIDDEDLIESDGFEEGLDCDDPDEEDEDDEDSDEDEDDDSDDLDEDEDDESDEDD